MKPSAKRCLSFAIIIIALTSMPAFPSWSKHSKHLADYLNSGAYYQDISEVIKEATYYLQFRLTQNLRTHNPHKLAIVMDIDETALSNYNRLKFYNYNATPTVLKKIASEGNNPAIPHTLALYNYARDHNVAIFFITGRNSSMAKPTIDNLKKAGYHEWNTIAFSSGSSTNTAHYYTQQRQRIQKLGYDIIMNIGNRQATLIGGAADMIFQLPNPFYE